MVSYVSKDGNTHVIMRNGDHYVARNGHFVKIRSQESTS